METIKLTPHGSYPEVLSVRDLRPPARSTRPSPLSAALLVHRGDHKVGHNAGQSAAARQAQPTQVRQGRSVQTDTTTNTLAPERRIARRLATPSNQTNNNTSQTNSTNNTSTPTQPNTNRRPLSPETTAQLHQSLVAALRKAIGDEPVSRYFNEGNAFTLASDGSVTVHLPSDFQARRARRYDADLRKAVAAVIGALDDDITKTNADINASATEDIANAAQPAINYHISLNNAPTSRPANATHPITNAEPKPRLANLGSTNNTSVNTRAEFTSSTSTSLASNARRRRFHPSSNSNDAFDQLVSDDRYALERFITGPSNQLAYRAAVYVASGLGAATENQQQHNHHSTSAPDENHPQHRHVRSPAFVAPERVGHLFLHGSCGTGKTHLLLGIARRFKQCNPSAAVRYITGPAFADAYIHAVRTRNVPAFRRAYRNVGLLCIDDVHFLADKDGTQTELLHTFDELDLGGATVILASDDHPKRIERFRSALVSRFVSGLVLEVQRPDRDLFKRILEESCRRTGLRLDASASARLLDELEPGTSSVRDLEGLVLKVNAMTAVLGVRDGVIGLSIIEQAIRGGRASNTKPGAASRKPIRLDALVTEICAYLGVELEDLKGSGRHKRVVLARSMAAFLGRSMTSASFPELARAMNRKSHSAVIAARDRFHEQLERDAPAPPFDDHIQQLGARTLRDLVALTKSHVERHAR